VAAHILQLAEEQRKEAAGGNEEEEMPLLPAVLVTRTEPPVQVAPSINDQGRRLYVYAMVDEHGEHVEGEEPLDEAEFKKIFLEPL
jgi:hypothetical protein